MFYHISFIKQLNLLNQTIFNLHKKSTSQKLSSQKLNSEIKLALQSNLFWIG